MADDDEAVQSEDQGGESGLYSEYLERMPEEAREAATEAFKDFDRNVNKKLQEAAEYRKQWEPLEETGVSQRSREEVEWAMQFVDALRDPTAIKEWFDGYAQENGLTKAEQAELEQEYVDPSVQSLVEQQLQAQLGPVSQQMAELAQWREQREMQEREQQAAATIESQLNDLREKHPEDYNRPMIEKFVAAHMSDPEHAVELAFKDWQEIRNQVSRDTLQGKADTPPGAEHGGSANGTPDPPPRGQALKYAAEQALAQMKAANRT